MGKEAWQVMHHLKSKWLRLVALVFALQVLFCLSLPVLHGTIHDHRNGDEMQCLFSLSSHMPVDHVMIPFTLFTSFFCCGVVLWQVIAEIRCSSRVSIFRRGPPVSSSLS